MSDIPSNVSGSRLWNVIQDNSQLLQAIKDIREIAETISSKISELSPSLTDHSVKHMDMLWKITETVFTLEEIKKISISEAFILACSFYVHDLGMAYCLTEEGRKNIEKLTEYQALYSRLIKSNMSKDEARIKALQIETRKIHAQKALGLVQNKLPALDMYLIENTELRQKWSENIGLVSSSHNWSIQELNDGLGCRGEIPDSLGTSMDLGFVSCALRIIDYAHLNHERASTLDRLLINDIGKESLVHWLALENVTGPSREDDKLVYGSSKKIESVDGWWKCYELAQGLNKEIIAVQEYLDSRSCSKGRFSLRGIKGIEAPEDFAIFVQPKDFEPIDIRFRADSIERLIGLLGGTQLYGEDYSAPLRELIQNAIDAINLYRTQHDKDDYGEISVVIENGSHQNYLTVRDNGIGMGKNTVTKYLLSIASDYWNSKDFTQDYPEASIKNFKPVGKYGIGFLSVFMISDNVEIETEKIGGSRLNLYIKGLGQRGYLKTNNSTGISGTKVKMRISNKIAEDYKGLPAIIKAKAPMVNIPIKVQYGKNKEENILPKWWKRINQEGLTRFLAEPVSPISRNREKRYLTGRRVFIDDDYRMFGHYQGKGILSKMNNIDKWPGKQPEIVSDTFRIIALPTAAHVLICSKGLGIRSMPIHGMVGLVDIGEVELDASRSYTLGWDHEKFREDILEKLSPEIISALNNIQTEMNIPERFEFLADVGKAYGHKLLTKTKLKWINIIKPPGDIILISAEELRKIIAEVKEIFIVYGTSPWNSYSICRKRFGEVAQTTILITISSKGQPEPGSYTRDEDEIIECPLPEHFLVEYHRGFENAVMIKAILDIISEGWNISIEHLLKSEWNRRKQILCGRIRRIW